MQLFIVFVSFCGWHRFLKQSCHAAGGGLDVGHRAGNRQDSRTWMDQLDGFQTDIRSHQDFIKFDIDGKNMYQNIMIILDITNLI